MNLTLILAVADNGLIGNGQALPWNNITSDMNRFKKITTGGTVVMGRSTWESLPSRYRPLPNRKNIVISRNKKYIADGATVMTDVKELEDITGEVFLIGGANLLHDLYPFVTKVHMTKVKKSYSGDVYLSESIRADLSNQAQWTVKAQEYLPETVSEPSTDYVVLIKGRY